MSDDKLRIERAELFDPAVDKALARERAGRERIVADTPPVSPVRRLLLNSLFHMPLAAVLAALVVWMLLEPKIDDTPVVGGEVTLVNTEPFDVPRDSGIIALTVGEHEVYVLADRTKYEAGASGQPPIAGVDAIVVGSRIEVAGMVEGQRMYAAAIRPTDRRDESYGALDKPVWPLALLFPLTAALIAFAILFAEGLTTRNWIRMIERSLIGSFLAALFAALAFLPAGVFMLLTQKVLDSEMANHPDAVMITVRDLSGWNFLLVTMCRSAAWACVGAATGVGMNLVRATRAQLRNTAIGGALGGALGGMFFDAGDRYLSSSMFSSSETSRLVGLIAVGLSMGIFVALVERLAREAWLRVRTGPLTGKSFILYKTPTFIGNAPASDVYLYKDAEIDPTHAAIHRVGTTYEIEDLGSRMGTAVTGDKVRRKRLVSGDQIVVGSTILDFEERQQRTPAA